MQNHGTIRAQASSIDTVKKTRVPVETEKTDDVKRIVKCKFCGSFHNRGSCPAYGATCHKCNGRNHYARCCLKSRSNIEERQVRHVEVEANEENESLEEIQGSTRRNIQSDLLVNNTPVTFKLDTRAECNVMSIRGGSRVVQVTSRNH